MEKSAAYLMGFQAGFGEELELEKVAQFIELLEFVPENPQQAEEFMQKNAGFLRSFLSARASALKKLISRRPAAPKVAPKVTPARASLRVARRGETAGQFEVPGMPGKLPGKPGELKVKGPRFGE
jgi:hypothetical protein